MEEIDVSCLAEQLRPAILRLARHLRREAQRVGLSAMDAQLLALVSEQPEIGVSDLADLEQMSRPAMSAHIKRLIDAKWVKRKKNGPDEDKRHVSLVITAEGCKVLSATSKQRTDWLAARLAKLSDRDRGLLTQSIAVFTEMLNESSAE
jgi:DNA-binding MarR family transcriptional regulator